VGQFGAIILQFYSRVCFLMKIS